MAARAGAVATRAVTLAWALRRLPDPDEFDGPTYEVRVPGELHIFELTGAPEKDDAHQTESLVPLVFRRETFGNGRHRWHEWVLDHLPHETGR